MSYAKDKAECEIRGEIDNKIDSCAIGVGWALLVISNAVIGHASVT